MCADTSLGLCLIYFVDGKEKTSVKKALKLFKDLQKMPDMKGNAITKTFQFYYLIFKCELPSLVETLAKVL